MGAISFVRNRKKKKAKDNWFQIENFHHSKSNDPLFILHGKYF